MLNKQLRMLRTKWKTDNSKSTHWKNTLKNAFTERHPRTNFQHVMKNKNTIMIINIIIEFSFFVTIYRETFYTLQSLIIKWRTFMHWKTKSVTCFNVEAAWNLVMFNLTDCNLSYFILFTKMCIRCERFENFVLCNVWNVDRKKNFTCERHESFRTCFENSLNIAKTKCISASTIWNLKKSMSGAFDGFYTIFVISADIS